MDYRIVFFIAIISVLVSSGYTLNAYADHVNYFAIQGRGGHPSGDGIEPFISANHANTLIFNVPDKSGMHSSAYNNFGFTAYVQSQLHTFLDSVGCRFVGPAGILDNDCRLQCSDGTRIFHTWDCDEVALLDWPKDSNFKNYPSKAQIEANANFISESYGWDKNVEAYRNWFDANYDKSQRVIISAFSWGGNAATAIVSDPANREVIFDFFWLMDPVGSNDKGFLGGENCVLGVSPKGICPTRHTLEHQCDLSNPANKCDTDTAPERVYDTNLMYMFYRWQFAVNPPFGNDHDYDPTLFGGTPFEKLGIITGNNDVDTDLDGNNDVTVFCDPFFARCHSQVAEEPAFNGVKRVLQLLNEMNKKPTLTFTGPFQIDELDFMQLTATDSLTEWDFKHGAFQNFRYFDPNTGVPRGQDSDVGSPVLSDTETCTKNIHAEGESLDLCEKVGTFTGSVSSEHLDGGSTPTHYPLVFQVYDSGWPCDDCTDGSIGELAANGASGKWAIKQVNISVSNAPPIPSIELLTDSKPSTTAAALEAETCLPDSEALIIDDPNIEIKISALDSIPDKDFGMLYTVSWGDGTPDSSELTTSDTPASFTHTVRKVGDSTITVSVKDKDEGIGMASITISLPDSDCDGIQDLVDTLPDEFSDDYAPSKPLCWDERRPGDDPPPVDLPKYNPVTNLCESEGYCESHASGAFIDFEKDNCVFDFQDSFPVICEAGETGQEGFGWNPVRDLCEAPPICSNSDFNPDTDRCEIGSFGTIIDRGDQDVSIIDEDFPDGVFIGAFTTSDGAGTFGISADEQIVIQVLEADPGAPAEISVCGDSALLRIVSGDSAIVTCGSVTIKGFSGTVEADFQVRCNTHTASLSAGQIITFDPKTLTYTNDGTTDISIRGGSPSILEAGDTQLARSSCGSSTHEPPTIGKNLAGTKQMVNNGFCIDADCFTVTKLFHEEFKLYEMMSGTHTLSTTVFCAQGVQHCNYSAIGIMPYDKDMNDAVWKIEMKRNFLGEVEPVIYDPEGFLGEVTITTQIVNDKFLAVSYTIEFKNKQTPPMKVGVQLRDDKHGVRNFYFNEGVQFNDSDSYPYVEASFEQPLKVEKLCINPQSHDRDSCGFDLVQEWTEKKAQDILDDMLNGNYIHDKYVRDRYYD